MQVILTQDVDSLGLTGQVVEVKRGFARNMLIPAHLALQANATNLKRLEKERATFEERSKKEKDRARDLAAQLKAVRLTIAQKAGEKDKLYGSVTTMDLAAALAEKGFDLDRRKIKLSEPIKTLGDFEITVKLHGEVTAAVKVSVVRAE
ncbi:MAG: 50S ribosomal protein L9 [Pseudomonadota bacterium]